MRLEKIAQAQEKKLDNLSNTLENIQEVLLAETQNRISIDNKYTTTLAQITSNILDVHRSHYAEIANLKTKATENYELMSKFLEKQKLLIKAGVLLGSIATFLAALIIIILSLTWEVISKSIFIPFMGKLFGG